MKRFCIMAFVFVLAVTPNLPAQTRLQSFGFYSKSVHDTMRVRILLPTNYDQAHTYAVLFLLHGYSGDETNWTALTGIEKYTSTLSLIVVMPEARNSWYVNSETDRSLRYEDYIVDDLPDFVNSLYRIDTTKEAIAGLSMGGYGALVLAMRHPQRYKFAGDLSGAITIPSVIDSVLAHPGSPVPGGQASIYPSIVSAFGDSDESFRDEHDVLKLLSSEKADSIPYIFCVVGIQDGFKNFLPAHRAFTDSLREYRKLYEYHEVPGIHNWKFWDEEIRPLLARMAIVMKLARQSIP